MRTGKTVLLTAGCLLALLFSVPLLAQVNTRAAEIEQARREKAEKTTPEKSPGTETALNYIKEEKILERFMAGVAGFRIKLGGLATGQGFALGPEYLREDLANGNMIFRGSAGASFSKAQLYDLQLTLPHLANDKLFVDLYAVHHNYPRIDYFGPGPDSLETNRTSFRLEDTTYDFTTGVKPLRNLSLGVTGGYLQINTGSGTRNSVPSTESLFSPATTPGLVQQTDFLRGGTFVQYDYRDNPGGPRSGGNYLAKFVYYDDRNLGLHTFRQLEIEAQQYIPFFNERRVIALRARTILSFTGQSQSVPFYLQPVLGGSEDLRGFKPYRFYDDNQIVVNAEYRWESFTGLDMALFVDAGKVVPTRSQINFHDLEASAGFGFRFNVRNSTFLRLDVGFGHEGTQIWLKFANPF
jgi:outer membrane protein assembly factor BamA